ncbi:hypothetical protein RM780_02580 [Streptomyces sp. DSM 44917]|uniref:Uncharacterized protein n=1 Tax=Streptomyces boetiae TaxID=3075541 RepID=A0ABU2L2R9_9ACTN|nr:hypothetical protein [Streptomyces sp. DSM 44917]MDT0305849.1 hypothetical protein [Streptomyces sp. DSM 44917]
MSGHAELAEIWPRDGRLRLVGHLHGRRAGWWPGRRAGAQAWELLAELRDPPGGEARRVRAPAELEGGTFEVSVPVTEFAPADLELPVYWDLHLASGPSPDAERLRLGRHLDDIRGKKNIMVYPGQPVARAGHASAVVKPYYTLHDNLSVEVSPA